jgi:hypothetical protein
MTSLARKIHDDLAPRPRAREVTTTTATVIALGEGGRVVARGPHGDVDASRAVSCLVAPAVGDLVTLADAGPEGAFVTAILRRTAEAPIAIAIDGDLDVRLASGRFRVAAQDGVDLVSADEVRVTGRRLDVKAEEGDVFVDRLAFLGRAVRAEIDRVKLVAQSLDGVFDRVTERVKRAYRRVEELDQLKAERIDYTADKTMALHAEHALVTADELVKVDAEQIHLG